MANEKVFIDELILRVPGIGEQEVLGIGQEVALGITERLPYQQRDGHIGELNLNVTVPDGTSRGQMTRLIFKSILKGLA